MPFDDVLKSIFVVPEDVPILENEYSVKGGHGHTSYSKTYWDRVSETPTNAVYWQTYQFLECKEHGVKEAVPTSNYYDGWLKLWYDAGLHPRWNIWGELKSRWPVTRFPSRFRAQALAKEFLIEYKDDPEGFVRVVHDTWYKDDQTVSMRANGRTWRVTRRLRDKYKSASFTIKEFLDTTNQTERQLMLMSRSFETKEILKHMSLIGADKEGELYRYGNLIYLHVKDSSTEEDYLLSVPLKVCKHGIGTINNNGDAIWHNGTRCEGLTLLTPSMARRWTLNVPLDANILLET